MRPRQWLLTALGGLCGFALTAAIVVFLTSARGQDQHASAGMIGGPFTLVDDTGATVTERSLTGKPTAIYFGYTFCPEVCPTTLMDLARWMKALGSDADRLNYVFVSIDPERDTPKLMHDYVGYFDKRIRGFTGTPEQVAKIAREYRVFYKRIPTDDGGYVMDHSAAIYLMTADGKLTAAIGYQEADASALAKLHALIATEPSS